MKIKLFVTIFILPFSLFAQAMLIHRSDGSIVKIQLADINKITFNISLGNIQNPEIIKKFKMAFANILPNPFNTQFVFSVPQKSNVNISVFNAQGKLIKKIKNEIMEPGNYSSTWKGVDERGAKVVSGCYIVKIVIGDNSIAKNLLIVR